MDDDFDDFDDLAFERDITIGPTDCTECEASRVKVERLNVQVARLTRELEYCREWMRANSRSWSVLPPDEGRQAVRDHVETCAYRTPDGVVPD